MQVPQSYNIKAASIPSYSTVLNSVGLNEKQPNLYMNSSTPFLKQSTIKNDFIQSTPSNGTSSSNIYQNNENFYTNQAREKFNHSYKYDDTNLYSNIGNIPAPQVPTSNDGSSRATRNAVYSNIEPAVPIPVPQLIQKEKDLVYSNIQWNPTRTENTYCNIPAQNHSNGKYFFLFEILSSG